MRRGSRPVHILSTSFFLKEKGSKRTFARNCVSLQRVKKASQSSRAAVGSCAAIRMRPAPCGYAARRRRKKIKSFFRRRVRRKNTLRGASVESSAMGGRPRRKRSETPLAEKASAFFDSLARNCVSLLGIPASCFDETGDVPLNSHTSCTGSGRR